MKKRVLVLMIVLVTMVCGLSQKAISGIRPVSNYMSIEVSGMTTFTITAGNTTVTIYNSQNQVVHSFYVPYAGIYPVWLQLPSGTYKAVLTGYNIYEVDYFTL